MRELQNGVDFRVAWRFSFLFRLNLIPFAGPSNLFIASTAAFMVDSDRLLSGFLVAFGASLAKGAHYMVTFFVSKHLSEKRRQRLDAEGLKVKKWAFLLLFVAAATPIPDEPIVIPLGLMKYSPAKFFTAFFLGKLSITIAGAALGTWTEGFFSGVAEPRSHDCALDSSDYSHHCYTVEGGRGQAHGENSEEKNQGSRTGHEFFKQK